MSETFDTAREAATARGPETSNAVANVEYQRDGERVPSTEVVSLDKASADLTAFRGTAENSRALSLSRDFADAVDLARVQALGLEQTADAARQGIALAKEVGIEAPSSAAIDVVDGDQLAEQVAPDLERALAHPQVREAIQDELAKAGEAAEHHHQALANAQDWAREAFVAACPALAAVPIEHFAEALQMLAQVDPQQYQIAQNLLNRVGQAQAAAHFVAQARQDQQQRELAAYDREQNAAFDSTVKLTPNEKAALTDEMVSFAGENGISREVLIQIFKNNPVLRHSVFQRLIHTAMTSRISKRTALPRPSYTVPPVQKPGTSQPGPSRAAAGVNEAAQRFAKSGSVKDAAALQVARRRNAGK